MAEVVAQRGGGVGVLMRKASLSSDSGRFMLCSVESVMRCTSSAWIVVASRRAFCSSQNCTVRNSPMRLSSSSGSSVGAIHCPMPGTAAPAPLIRL